MLDPDCLFCRITSGQDAADLIYEDEHVLAFLPRDLVARGHTLIAPRRHLPAIWDLPADLLDGIMRAAQLLSERYRGVLGASGINLLHASGTDAQQSVPHFHIHLLPRFPGDGLDAWPPLPEVHVDRVELTRQLRGEG